MTKKKVKPILLKTKKSSNKKGPISKFFDMTVYEFLVELTLFIIVLAISSLLYYFTIFMLGFITLFLLWFFGNSNMGINLFLFDDVNIFNITNIIRVAMFLIIFVKVLLKIKGDKNN